jgi:uncharacterized membrane protein
MGKGGDPSKEKREQWRRDPSNWLWGFIYYNREDPRLFLPKRLLFTGCTINFANRGSAALFAALLASLIVLAVLAGLAAENR